MNRPKILILVLLLMLGSLASCAKRLAPLHDGYVEVGSASWYGQRFQGKTTASGERYDMHKLTAAHPRAPFGSQVRVTNLSNGRSVEVRINDRGPFARNRVIDLSKAAALALGFIQSGTANVRLEFLQLGAAK